MRDDEKEMGVCIYKRKREMFLYMVIECREMCVICVQERERDEANTQNNLPVDKFL